MNNQVILLFGMPRSGTTWIGKIFDSHPDTLYMHEPDSWEKLDMLPLFTEEDSDLDNCSYVQEFISLLPNMRKAQVTSKLPVFRKSYQSVLHFQLYRLSIYVSSIAHKLGFSKSVDPLARVSAIQRERPIIVWKSIESLGRMPYVANCINGKSMVHIVRNPAGYIASVLNGERKNTFQSSTPSSEDFHIFEMLLSTARGKSLGYSMSELKQLDPVERLAIRWRLYNEIVYEQCCTDPNYQMLVYEDICRDPESVTKRLFQHCGLTWNNQSTDFVLESTSQNKDAYYSVYKSPLEAAYKWKKSLDDSEIRKIVNILSGSTALSWYEKDFQDYI